MGAGLTWLERLLHTLERCLQPDQALIDKILYAIFEGKVYMAFHGKGKRFCQASIGTRLLLLCMGRGMYDACIFAVGKLTIYDT